MSRRQVCEILRQRLSDPQEIATARKEAMELRHSNVTKGHRERRVRVIRDLTTTGDVPTLIRLWEKTLAPNVTVSYAATLLKLRPDLRTPMVKDAIDRVRQKAGPLTTKRAKAVTAVQMRHLLESGPERVQRTLLLLFLGACRHADLLRVQCLHSTAIIRGGERAAAIPSMPSSPLGGQPIPGTSAREPPKRRAGRRRKVRLCSSRRRIH